MSLNSVTRKKRLTKRALKRALERQGLPKINIVFYDETDSTNTRARLYAECCEDKKRRDTLFVARKQRGGRGRMGRSFVSRGETGLWMSLLRFNGGEGNVGYTVRAAVAVCRAVEGAVKDAGAECNTTVKWVNDVYIGGKKLCGILAEGGYADEGRLPYSVIGIGINLYKTDFDGELAAIATDLYSECGKNLCRATLAAGIIKELWYSDKRDFTDEYRRRSFIIGERVTVLRAGESYEATAISIGDDGALTVRTENGEERKLISGEVSIRRSLI